MKKTTNHVIIEIFQGDIAAQKDIDAVVNAANAQLMPGGGVAGAIHRAAGSKLAEACKPLAPILPGQAVITPAFNLPNKFVIHCLGPVYSVDKPEDELLSRCYLNALKLGEEKHIRSIAFPAISTGAFGYPVDDAADVALHCVQQLLPGLHSIRLIRFVLYSPGNLKIYKEKAGDIL
jgi:O-acetyl-ADP-ribose deacetylase (regulator of RNase III)